MSRWRWMIPALLLGLALALASCASGGGAPSVAHTLPTLPAATATATPQPTATAEAPSPTALASAQQCRPGANAYSLGDLALSQPTVLYAFNADFMLPDGTSLTRPLTVTLQNNGAFVGGGALQNGPVVQPISFDLGVCNTSATATHHLTAFGVTLATLTPYTGQLNAMNGCALLYARSGSMGGECASGFSPGLDLAFQFPAAATLHATVTQTQTQTTDLAPGQGIDISFSIQPPTSTAFMTYRLGVGIDGQAITYPDALTTQTTISAPISHRWAGDYCSASAMQSQIPTASPANTYYVCPKS